MDRLGDLRPVEQHVQFFLVSHGLSDDSTMCEIYFALSAGRS
jgi:hypothetical protein